MDPQFNLRGVAKDYAGLQVTMVLIAEHDGLARCVGGAFAVDPGLAITASQAIDDSTNDRPSDELRFRPPNWWAMRTVSVEFSELM